MKQKAHVYLAAIICVAVVIGAVNAAPAEERHTAGSVSGVAASTPETAEETPDATTTAPDAELVECQAQRDDAQRQKASLIETVRRAAELETSIASQLFDAARRAQ